MDINKALRKHILHQSRTFGDFEYDSDRNNPGSLFAVDINSFMETLMFVPSRPVFAACMYNLLGEDSNVGIASFDVNVSGFYLHENRVIQSTNASIVINITVCHDEIFTWTMDDISILKATVGTPATIWHLDNLYRTNRKWIQRG